MVIPDDPVSRVVRLTRRHLGLRVIGGEVILEMSPAGRLLSVDPGIAAPITLKDIVPRAPASAAQARAFEQYSNGDCKLRDAAELVIYTFRLAPPALAWEVGLGCLEERLGDVDLVVYVSDGGEVILDTFATPSPPLLP